MRWSLARDPDDLTGLFERWRTDAILLKRSDTFGGTGVTLFTREHVADLEWNPCTDVFCPEVNPDDGDIYKLEMIGPTVLLGWRSRVPPARSSLRGGVACGLYGAYGERERFELPESVIGAARAFGEHALGRGHGHVSLDFMRTPAGELEAIEVNLGNVALWWTTQFRSFRRNFAHAVHRTLVERHDAPATPAGVPVRIGAWASRVGRFPKGLVRGVQTAWNRRRISSELVARHGPRSDPGVHRSTLNGFSRR